MDNLDCCLICGIKYPQKGLTFFKFPKDDLRFKEWMKAVSPVLVGLKISNKFKETARICAKHFKDKDFINLKKNSLVHNACPFINVNDLKNDQVRNDESSDVHQRSYEKEISINSTPDSDTFKCGRCKAEFQLLSAFMDHKRSNCVSNKEVETSQIQESNMVPTENILMPSENTFLLNFDNRLPLENCTFHTINEEGEMVEIVNETNEIIEGTDNNENDFVSFIINDNNFLIGNTVNLSVLNGQLILTPEVKSNVSDVVLKTDARNENILLTDRNISCENTEISSNLVLTSEITNDENSNSLIVKPTPGIIFNNEDDINDKAEVMNTQEMVLSIRNCTLAVNAMEQSSKMLKKKGKLQCSYCDKIFHKPFNLQQHERTHTGERPFQCIICGRAFAQKVNVRKHMIRHKVWPQAKQTLRISLDESEGSMIDQNSLDQIEYSCQYCTLSFESYLLLKKHMVVHSDQKVYRCIQKECTETFADVDEFLSHSESHTDLEFKCSICFKVFTNLGELGAHQYDHGMNVKEQKDSHDLKLKCKKCHARFKTIESLKNHEATDSHNYECPQCKSVFICERFLRRHLSTHLDPSRLKFKCDKCEKSFRTRKYLFDHSFVHSKDKPFNCELCDKKFASKYRLIRHMAVHFGQNLECPMKSRLGCDKTFYRKDKLRDHVATHGHVKMRSCPVCTKNFATSTKLTRHLNKKHKMKRISKCLNCSQTFRKEKQLLQHCCTVDGKKFRSRNRNRTNEKSHAIKQPEMVSNIEIIMVPFAAGDNAIEDNIT